MSVSRLHMFYIWMSGWGPSFMFIDVQNRFSIWMSDIVWISVNVQGELKILPSRQNPTDVWRRFNTWIAFIVIVNEDKIDLS